MPPPYSSRQSENRCVGGPDGTTASWRERPVQRGNLAGSTAYRLSCLLTYIRAAAQRGSSLPKHCIFIVPAHSRTSVQECVVTVV